MLKVDTKNRKFTLPRGITIISGQNGSGKTTFFNDIFKGKIKLEVTEFDSLELNRSEISYLQQKDDLIDFLSISEIIEIVHSQQKFEEAYKYASFFDVNEPFEKDYKVKELSGGERQKVNLIINLLFDSPVLLLDEVDNNLDDESLEKLINYLATLEKYILVITHNEDYYIDKAAANIYINEFEVVKIKCKKEPECLHSIERKSKVSVKEKQLRKLKKIYFPTAIIGACAIIPAIYILFVFALITANAIPTYSSDEKFESNSSIIMAPLNNPIYARVGTAEWLSENLYLSKGFVKEVSEKVEFEKIEPMAPIYNVSNYTSYWKGDKQYIYTGDELQISKDTLTVEQLERLEEENISIESAINVEFNSLLYSKDVFTNTPYNFGIDYLVGEYPEDNTNEVLLPIEGGIYLANEKNADFSSLLGEEISLPLVEVDEMGQKIENTDIKEKFIISGYYYSGAGEKTIKYSYDEEGKVVTDNLCSYANEEEVIACIYDSYIDYMNNDDVFKKAIEEEKVGNYPGFYVEVADSDMEERLTKIIREIDPYVFIDNNYVREKETASPLVIKVLKKKMGISIVVSELLALTLVVLLARLRNRVKELHRFAYITKIEGNVFNQFENRQMHMIVLTWFTVIIAMSIILLFWNVNRLVLLMMILDVVIIIVSILIYIKRRK